MVDAAIAISRKLASSDSTTNVVSVEFDERTPRTRFGPSPV